MSDEERVEDFERLHAEAQQMAWFGFDNLDFVVETLRRTWTEEERDALALHALRELVPSWVKGSVKESTETFRSALKDAAKENARRRVRELDEKTRMRALWEEEVSPYRDAGTTSEYFARRLRLQTTDNVQDYAGEPETPELKEFLATPAGEHVSRIWMRRDEKRHFAERAQYLREQKLVAAVRRKRDEEWTRALLDERFVTPTGQAVSWGSATIDQHNQRIEVLNRSALSNIETMKRHEQAVRDLISADAPCLNSLVGAP